MPARTLSDFFATDSEPERHRESAAGSEPVRDSVMSSASGRMYLSVTPALPDTRCSHGADESALEWWAKSDHSDGRPSTVAPSRAASRSPPASPDAEHGAGQTHALHEQQEHAGDLATAFFTAPMLASEAPPSATEDERDRTIVALRQRVAELETFRLGFRNMISRARSYKSQLLESRAYADSLHSDYNRLLGAHWSAATPAPPPSPPSSCADTRVGFDFKPAGCRRRWTHCRMSSPSWRRLRLGWNGRPQTRRRAPSAPALPARPAARRRPAPQFPWRTRQRQHPSRRPALPTARS